VSPIEPKVRVTLSPHVGVASEARFEKSLKDSLHPAITTRVLIKEINRVPWDGRIFDPYTSYFRPITDSTREEFQTANNISKLAKAALTADIIKGKHIYWKWMSSQIEDQNSELRHILRQIKVGPINDTQGEDSRRIIIRDQTLDEPDVIRSSDSQIDYELYHTRLMEALTIYRSKFIKKEDSETY